MEMQQEPTINYAQLPDELKAQLTKAAKNTELKSDIIGILLDSQESLNVDELLIKLWQKTDQIHHRYQVQQVLAELVERKTIEVKGTRHKRRFQVRSQQAA